jgi:hypothetical protein
MNLLSTLTGLLDKIIPDANERQKAKAALATMEESGELRRYQAIITESQSEDKWVKRARPMFLYVVYAYLLTAPIFGLISVFFPAESITATTGLKLWLEAIPGELYALFGAGYLGYAVTRSNDKKNALKSLFNK